MLKLSIETQNIRVTNGSVSKMSDVAWAGSLLSNGLYKITLQSFDDIDEKLSFFNFYIESRFHEKSVANV